MAGRRKRRRRKDTITWIWEFSKRVVCVTALLYIFHAAYAAVMCFVSISTAGDAGALSTLITETNETFRVVVGGYMVKAGVENAVKIAMNKRGKKQGAQEEGADDMEIISLE